MQTKLSLILMISIVLFGGCAQKKSDLNTDFQNRNVTPEHRLNKSNISSFKYDVLLVADNQFNNIFTDPSIMRNGIAEMKSKVSIRPPQLDIYAKYLFKDVLKNEKAKEKYVIHLGDALNIACINEWNMFENILASVDKKKFVMAPGNHDFYWFGVTDGYTDNIKLEWGKACSDVYYPKKEDELSKEEYLNLRMTKGKFIDKYVEFIQGHNKDAGKSGLLDIKSNLIQKTYIKRFDGKEDNYRSFILQLIDLPNKEGTNSIKGIVIDTSNYDEQPLNFYGWIEFISNKNPGLNAGITEKQFDKIDEWINEFKKGQQFIIFGHHPLNAFDSKLKEKIDNEILNKKNLLGYISAHTHLGYVDINLTAEINIGSITDYPNEIRTLNINSTNNIISKSILISPYYANNKYCNAKYDYTASFPNYISYEFAGRGVDTAHKAHEINLDISIKTYLRQFDDLNITSYLNDNELIELDKKVKSAEEAIKKINKCKGIAVSKTNKKCRRKKLVILKELKIYSTRVEKSNYKYRNNLETYGVCQSLWASKAEWIKNNTKY